MPAPRTERSVSGHRRLCRVVAHINANCWRSCRTRKSDYFPTDRARGFGIEYTPVIVLVRVYPRNLSVGVAMRMPRTLKGRRHPQTESERGCHLQRRKKGLAVVVILQPTRPGCVRRARPGGEAIAASQHHLASALRPWPSCTDLVHSARFSLLHPPSHPCLRQTPHDESGACDGQEESECRS